MGPKGRGVRSPCYEQPLFSVCYLNADLADTLADCNYTAAVDTGPCPHFCLKQAGRSSTLCTSTPLPCWFEHNLQARRILHSLAVSTTHTRCSCSVESQPGSRSPQRSAPSEGQLRSEIFKLVLSRVLYNYFNLYLRPSTLAKF